MISGSEKRNIGQFQLGRILLPSQKSNCYSAISMVKLTMAGLARGTVLAMALFLLSHEAVSFNLDLEHPLHFTAPVVAGDYFGYSLAVDDDVLYAGAPGFRESGAVFRCPFSFSSGLNFGCQKVENRGE